MHINRLTSLGAVVGGIIMLGFVGIFFITASTQLTLNDGEVVSFVIAIITASGGLISAAFVVFSYWQTNEAHVEAQRPQLLIRVQSLRDEATNLPVTVIHYENVTRNKFNDLTIRLTISIDGREYSLSRLFRPEMTMIGLDGRQRLFHPYAELANEGVDMQTEADLGRRIELHIGYEYTFFGMPDRVDAQKYEWNSKKLVWEIC